MNSQKFKIIDFLNANGWKIDIDTYGSDSEFWTYNKEDQISVDISDDEFVLLGGEGDFFSRRLDLYTFIGAMSVYTDITLYMTEDGK